MPNKAKRTLTQELSVPGYPVLVHPAATLLVALLFSKLVRAVSQEGANDWSDTPDAEGVPEGAPTRGLTGPPISVNQQLQATIKSHAHSRLPGEGAIVG